MLHVKHLALASLCVSLALSCEKAPPPTPSHAPITEVPPSHDTAPSPVYDAAAHRPALRDAARPTIVDRVDWSEAYSSAPLDDARVVALQFLAQAERPEVADHAAFVLGRRLSVERITSVLSVLPTRLHPMFARGACGRSAAQQPPSLPPTISAALAQPHPDVAIATWVFRSRRPVQNVGPNAMRTLMASPRFDDQLVAARLLVSPTLEAPFDLVEYMLPIPMATAFRSIALRASTIASTWHRWIDTVALRVRSNPRAWGNTWIALTESVPKTDPEVRSALIAALSSMRQVSTGDAGVDAAFRCANAVLADTLAGAVVAIPACADESNRWRSLVALVRYVKERPTDTQRAGILTQVLRDASGDLRVLEAVPEAAVELPPGLARSILQSVAASRDPGVLAALLEALALHVQHARTLPSSLREQLVRAPFGLDEAQSLEARQQALALARALNLPAPPGVSIVRAMQTAMQPDASVTPARSPHESNTFVGKLVVNTRAGRVVIAITENAAPEAARVVVEAAQGGRYNGTTFHRVVPGFVAQGGDPRGDGYGGTNNIVPTELSGMRFDRGAVGIALAGLDTGGMQFFVMTADAPHLDARYPWIGRVVEGMEVVDELMAGDVIERVEFIAR